MIYLFLGEDRAAKRQKIAETKAQYLPSDDDLKLDFVSLESQKCDPAEFKKALIAIPAVSQKRVILIHPVEKFNDQNKKILLDFIQTNHDHTVVILDSDANTAKTSFLKKIADVAEVYRFGRSAVKSNVFDMTRAMEERQACKALKLLNQLLDDGNHPLQIMGGLVWFWGNIRRRLSVQNFKKGLLILQEADLNIKRSRLKSEYAVEIVVTKLCSLIAC